MDLTLPLQRWGRLVAFPHTVFALPFALSIVFVLWRNASIEPFSLLLIILCLVSARTAAMGWNRIVDRALDAQNERTAAREIPSGAVSVSEAAALTVGSALVFLAGAWGLGWHCFVLAPFVLIVLLGYSYAKRFTALSHLFLGLALALAPGGVWYALTAEFSWEPIPLMAAVMVWVAGFDILYSCQDAAFDRQHGLYSVPSRLGVKGALTVSFVLHLLVPPLLLLFGVMVKLGVIYFFGVLVFSTILFSQHRLVKEDDLSQVDKAFFARNGAASILFLLFVAADCLMSAG